MDRIGSKSQMGLFLSLEIWWESFWNNDGRFRVCVCEMAVRLYVVSVSVSSKHQCCFLVGFLRLSDSGVVRQRYAYVSGSARFAESMYILASLLTRKLWVFGFVGVPYICGAGCLHFSVFFCECLCFFENYYLCIFSLTIFIIYVYDYSWNSHNNILPMKNCLLRSSWNFGGKYKDPGKCISGMVLVGTPRSWSMDLYSMSLHMEKGPHLAIKCCLLM